MFTGMCIDGPRRGQQLEAPGIVIVGDHAPYFFHGKRAGRDGFWSLQGDRMAAIVAMLQFVRERAAETGVSTPALCEALDAASAFIMCEGAE